MRTKYLKDDIVELLNWNEASKVGNRFYVVRTETDYVFGRFVACVDQIRLYKRPLKNWLKIVVITIKNIL